MVITSVNNQQVKDWVKLQSSKHRNATQTFLVEGQHLIEEAHKAKILKTQITLKSETSLYSDCPTVSVSENVMKKFSSNTSMNKHMAVCNFFSNPEELSDRIVVLDNVQDPANVGAIMRTAYALGYNSIVLSINSVDIYNEKLIKASQGAHFHMRVVRTDLLKLLPELKKKGYQLLSTDLATDITIDEVKPKERFAIVFGNEGQGISEEVLQLSDIRFKIPIVNFDSLNILSAVSICLYIESKRNVT